MAIKDWSTTAADNDDADGDIALVGNTTSIRNADNSQRAIMQKVKIWVDDNNGSRSTAGSSNTYTYASAGSASTPTDAFAAYATGDTLTIQANHTNTGAATLNVDSVGAKAIRKYVNGTEAALAPGDILSAAPFTVIYDADANTAAGAWILQNPQKGTGGWEFIEQKTISGASSADFLNLGSYRALRFNGVLIPDTDERTILLRTSVDNGANWTAGTAYSYNYAGGSNTSFVGSRVTGANAFIVSGFAVGNGSDRGVTLDDLKLWQFNQATKCRIVGNVLAVSNSDVEFPLDVAGRIDTAARNAVSFLGGSSSNISGYIVLEGIRS